MAEAANDLVRIENAERSISRREDREEECVLMTDHYELLEGMSPSCMAISVLGRLMLVTHENDVSLAAKPPKDGFKHIKYPHSLRASLVQISNDGHDAFHTAHINMDQIHLMTKNIPDLLNEVVRAAAMGTDRDLEMTTRDTLEKLGKRAKRCADLARGTEFKYHKVMDEIKELLEAAASTKGHHEQVLKENLQKLEILKAQEISEKEEQEESRKAKEEMEKTVNEARKLYKDAMDSMPSNWAIIGAGLAQEAMQTINMVLSFRKVIPAVGRMGSQAMDCISRARGNAPQEEPMCQDVPQINLDTTTTFSVQHCRTLIDGLLRSFDVKNNEVCFRDPVGGVIKVETSFTTLNAKLARSNSADDINTQMQEITRSAAGLCKQIDSIIKAHNLHGDSEALTLIKAEFERLLSEVQSLDATITRLAKVNPTPSRIPAPKPKETSEHEPSALAVMRDNAHFKVQKAQESLKLYEEQNITSEKRAQESRAQLQKTMAELKSLDLTNTDMENIQKTLMKGFHALSEVCTIWSELVKFFSQVANRVETTFYGDILGFNQKAQNMLDYESEFNRALMYDYAKNATQSTIAIESLSSMYVDVSGKFLLAPLSKLPKLIYPREGESIELLAMDLDRECSAAVNQIALMATEKREEYKVQVNRRLAKIESARKSLPPIPLEQQRNNARAIRNGMDFDPNDF